MNSRIAAKPMASQPRTAFDDVVARARSSEGQSEPAVQRLVAQTVESIGMRGELMVDVGCGRGNLWPLLRSRFSRCIGVDAVRYPELPPDMELCEAQLDSPIPLATALADLVMCVETIEHLENPRALMRELARLAKPGGWIIVTTPNQLSLSSIMNLIAKQRFEYFQDVHYPAHITALLEVDLMRMAAECGLHESNIHYTMSGRISLTAKHFPRYLARTFPRALSDHILLVARKPVSETAMQSN
jgi:2-polyprenyl-3-methyl-5-hydroxy-6-metoxy-1,4-benzoquinol methylase